MMGALSSIVDTPCYKCAVCDEHTPNLCVNGSREGHAGLQWKVQYEKCLSHFPKLEMSCYHIITSINPTLGAEIASSSQCSNSKVGISI